jgi:hypothetical protein
VTTHEHEDRTVRNFTSEKSAHAIAQRLKDLLELAEGALLGGVRVSHGDGCFAFGTCLLSNKTRSTRCSEKKTP